MNCLFSPFTSFTRLKPNAESIALSLSQSSPPSMLRSMHIMPKWAVDITLGIRVVWTGVAMAIGLGCAFNK